MKSRFIAYCPKHRHEAPLEDIQASQASQDDDQPEEDDSEELSGDEASEGAGVKKPMVEGVPSGERGDAEEVKVDPDEEQKSQIDA